MSGQIRYTPRTPGEVEKIVAEAASDSRPLEVCGGGSKRGMWARAPAALLDMTGVAGITNYDPDELVVTALAGTPLAELEAALAERHQMLAFEPFDHGPLFGEAPGRATLGGIVAANVSGSRRLSAGAARDHILGFTAVSGRGEAFKGGGAVVKNVTGFDLPKLMAGSWGTLAVLTSLTMRVLPRPRTEKTLLLAGLTGEAANRAMTKAMASRVAVCAAAHLPAERIAGLRIEGFGPSVDARCRELARELEALCRIEVIEAETSHAFWKRLSTLEMLPVDGHVLWRISLPPAASWILADALGAARAHCAIDWAGGLVWAALPENSLDAAGGELGSRIQDLARAHGGRAVPLRAPVAQHPPTGAPVRDPGLQQLQSRIKSAFDPVGILNPGLTLGADL
jgi:glycolate oxidase FAD binding subunit